MQGWIKLHRKLLNNPILKRPELLQLFVYCLLKSNHEPERMIFNNKEIVVEKGQFITGRQVMAKDLKQKGRTLYDRLKILCQLEIITCQTNNRFTLITVNNWGLYQSTAEETNSNSNNKPTTSQQQANTNKNDKNDKKLKKEINKEKNVVEKIQYAEFVSLTNAEHEALVAKVGEDGIKKCIEILDNYKGSTGKKYKSDYRTILNWVVQRYEDDKKKPVKSVPQAGNFEQRKYDDEYYEGFYKNTAGAK